MSSRADYLKKYTSGGKKDKKAKKKRKREKASAAASGMRLVESDDEWAAPAPGGAGFDAEADDEAPQVVFDDAEGAVKPEEVVRTRGAWAAVGGGGGGGSDSDAAPEHSAPDDAGHTLISTQRGDGLAAVEIRQTWTPSQHLHRTRLFILITAFSICCAIVLCIITRLDFGISPYTDSLMS